MSKKVSKEVSFFLKSIGEVFSFFFFAAKKTRRTKVFYLMSFLPVIMALVIKFVQIFSAHHSIQGISIFSSLIMVFYLQFLILILALFFGTSVCSEEIEGKTMTYLTTRPVSKSAILLGKYAAYTLLVILMMAVGLVVSFLILNIDNLGDVSLYGILGKYGLALILGLICYTSFFTFIGTFLKRSILFGLFFSFGWENVIQYFPGSTQKFAIVHYLKSLLPTSSGGRFSFLLFRLEPTPPALAIFMLFLITGVFLLLSCLFFSKKEYIMED